MAEIAWSEKRKALIPGRYENGMFVPFNGDDPIPQEAVLASRPPMTIEAIDDNGELRDMRPADAFRAAGLATSSV